MSTMQGSRSRSFTWEDPAALVAGAEGLSGLEIMSRIAAGTLPAPPIARMLGMTVAEVAPGRAVFAVEPAEWMYNPIGSVHGGIAATLLDSCMGCAVHTTLAAGVGYTTGDLHVRAAAGAEELLPASGAGGQLESVASPPPTSACPAAAGSSGTRAALGRRSKR